ncbi:MAG: aldo/keto reductase [Clostridium sp.]|nr:aldo/keto reductase [Clostridium sp.]
MKKRNLGKLEVGAVGLGCMGMTHAYGEPADEKKMIDLMHQAYDLGVTLFDTAECYTGTNPDGSTAYNEELVGKGIKGFRENIILATKFGVKQSLAGLEMDSRPEVIRKSVDGSLARLGTDYIDLYYLHRVDPKVPVEEVAGVMQELMDAGKIRTWGISECTPDELRRAHAVCPVTAVQHRFAMLFREHEKEMLPLCEELGVGFVAFSPLGNGFLSAAYNKTSKFTEKGDYRSFMPQFSEHGMDQNRPLLDVVVEYAEKKQATPAQIALAWVMAKKPFIVPIPGTRKPERLEENCKSAEVVLTPAEVSEIDRTLAALPPAEVYTGRK